MTIETRTDEELMQEFEAEQKAAKEANKSFDNFFFFLKEDGEKAVFHPLLNIPQLTLTKLPYHEKFDRAAGKMVADSVCAKHFGGQCKICREAEVTHDKKLQASFRLFLPVYVHSITRPDSFGKPVTVMAKDDDGIERPIQGVRMMKLKLGAAILDSLREFYYDSESRSILTSDFAVTRRGEGLDTRYTLTNRAMLPLDESGPSYTPSRVIDDVRTHRPEQAVASPVGDITPAAQITVAEALDMKPPTEPQLKRIVGLCQALGKDYVEPLSFGQAANMERNLRAEYSARLAEESVA